MRIRHRRKLAIISVLVCLVTLYVTLNSTQGGPGDSVFSLAGVRHSSSIDKDKSLARSDQHHEVYQNTPSARSIDRTLGEHPPRDISELENAVVPNIVHYFWCENRTFEYRHYLSVMSVWTFMEPDILTISYKSEPLQDKYNDWLDMLKTTIPNLVLYQVPSWATCDPCNRHITDLLYDTGGVYVDIDTILLHSPHPQRRVPFTAYFDSFEGLKLLFGVRHHRPLRDIPCFTRAEVTEKKDTLGPNSIKTCEHAVASSNHNSKKYDCIILAEPIYPKDILTQTSKMASILRFIAYGQSEPIYPSTDSTPIPKIVHYIWYNPANMTFIMYLSVLSSLHVLKADRVVIHGGDSLQGHFWEKVKADPRVVSLHRDPPREILGTQILYSHHKSDIIRADILYKYGGIYVDWDVLWLKPVDDLLSTGYDAIVDLDHMERKPYPGSINMGVVLAKPRSTYIKMWRKTYENYKRDDFFYNPIEVPYKIYERYPTSVKIEPRLQVMCYHLMCHPIFHPQYTNFQSSQPFDWRKDVYSIHFTFPDPDEYKNETALKNGHGMFADIGMFIYKSAHLI